MTTEVDSTARKVQAAQSALTAAQRKHDDAKRREAPPKHVSQMTPAEIQAERRRRYLGNNY